MPSTRTPQRNPVIRIVLIVALLLESGLCGATASLLPAQALQVVAIDVDGNSVQAVEDVSIRILPQRKLAATRLAINDTISRGTSLSAPARTGLTFKSLNGVVVRMEPDSELYVDAAIAGGEVYDLRRGRVRFETAQPLKFLVVRHSNGVALARQATFNAEINQANQEIRFTVERGAVDIEELVALVEVANNSRFNLYERSSLALGQSRIISLDLLGRKDARFDNAGAAEAYYAAQLKEAEASGDVARQRLAMRNLSTLALRHKKTSEAIAFNDKWLATGDDNTLLFYYGASAIARACQAESDITCATDYHEKALGFAERLYPDGLHGSVISTRRALAVLYRKDADQARVAAFNAETDTLDWRMFGETMASIAKRVEPKYPQKMREWRLQGDGLVDVVVTEAGKLGELKVIRSPHPAFEQAIVRSVLASQFNPPTKGGRPISAHLQIPFSFRFSDRVEKPVADDEASFAFPRIAGVGLPPNLQYDEPPEIKLVAPIVYPRDLIQGNVTGHAKVAVLIDDTGKVANVKVVEASHPDFGAATKAMMQAWTFSPAKRDKKPTATAFVYLQKFRWHERDTGTNSHTRVLLNALTAGPPAIAEMDALDARPHALYQPPPVDPRPPRPRDAPPEEVMIEFFIDPEGSVQLPRILSANDAELGWAAATALMRWIFEVPTRNGEPVYVRHVLRFVFK